MAISLSLTWVLFHLVYQPINISYNRWNYKFFGYEYAIIQKIFAYNNKLQKSLGNDKTSVVYKATSKIFENAKK